MSNPPGKTTLLIATGGSTPVLCLEGVPNLPSAKKDLHDPDNHDGVITDLEPDILECEVKWALPRADLL